MAKVLKGKFGGDRKADKAEAVPDPTHGYQFKVSLVFSDPLIWRRIRVPGTMTLAALHRVIQVCMNWNDEDSHQFLVGKIFYQPGFGMEAQQQRTPKYDEANYKLFQLEESMPFVFTYLYDGGDGWELELSLEEVIPGGAGETPLVVAGERACPPEDIGDIHHYQALLSALEQSGAEAELFRLEIQGQPEFYPDRFDPEAINQQLKELYC